MDDITFRDIAIAFGYEVDAKSEKKVNDSINKIKSTATKALGAIGIGFSLAKVKQVIEEFSKVNTQIQNATEGLGEQNDIQNEIIKAANAARVAYGDIAEVTSKLVQNNRDLFDVTSAAKYAELTAKLFRSEGKSQSEILSLQSEINKSFSKGAVEAGTVNQIIEKSPAAADLLAKKVGVARSELAKMASDGRISLEQLRDAFLGNADTIEAAFANVDLTISDALLNIRNQWGLWLSQMDSTLGVTKTIAKFMTRAFNQIMNALKKVQTWMERVVKVFGGAEKMLKMIAIAGGAFITVLAVQKIMAMVTAFREMDKALLGAKLKILGIAAVIAIVALLIEDFINFMQGNDSLLGEMLKRAGIDADAVREKIISVWQAIKDFLKKTWEFLTRIGKTIWGGLTKFWTDHGEKVKETLLAAWKAIKAALEAVWKALKTIATVVFNALKSFWKTWGNTITSIFGDIWDLIGKRFDSFLDILKGIFNLFTAIFTGDWESAWNAVKDIASAVWNDIKATFTTAKDVIVKVFDKLYDVMGPFAAVIAGITAAVVAYKVATSAMAVVQGVAAAATTGLAAAKTALAGATTIATTAFKALKLAMTSNPIGIIIALIVGLVAVFVLLWNKSEGFRNFFIRTWEGIKKVLSVFANFFKALWEGIKTFFKAIWDVIIAFFTMVWEIISGVVSTAGEKIKGIFTAVGDFFKLIWNGITSFFKNIWDGLLNIINVFVDMFKTAFTTVADFFKNIWNGVSDFFTSLWEGIKGTVKTVGDALVGFIKAPINGIIGLINGAIDGLNKIKVPDWVPIIGGKGINIPKIQPLAKGGVLKKGQTGYLEGDGAEAVVPLEKNTGWISKVAALFKKNMSSGDGAETVKGISEAVKGIGGIIGNAIKTGFEKVSNAKDNADKSGLIDAIRSFGSNIAALAKSATASPGTVQSMVTSTTNRSVTQNNYFESTFNGDRAGQKRSSEAMNKNANDATGELARALAYSR